jgi:hypothetical protein
VAPYRYRRCKWTAMCVDPPQTEERRRSLVIGVASIDAGDQLSLTRKHADVRQVTRKGSSASSAWDSIWNFDSLTPA